MKKVIFSFICNIICSVLSCVVLRPQTLQRSLMHFPIGSLGAYILHKSSIHGFIFFYLITIYQCMELYAHFKLYNEDYSWIDLEGYAIGFTYTTLNIFYINDQSTDCKTLLLPN